MGVCAWLGCNNALVFCVAVARPGAGEIAVIVVATVPSTEGLADKMVCGVADGLALCVADVMTVEFADLVVPLRVADVLILGTDDFLPEIVLLGVVGGKTGVDAFTTAVGS